MSTLSRLQHVMRELFDDDDLEIAEDMIAADVADWDSLSQVRLIVATEKEFGVRFDSGEIQDLASVGALLFAIEARGGS